MLNYINFGARIILSCVSMAVRRIASSVHTARRIVYSGHDTAVYASRKATGFEVKVQRDSIDKSKVHRISTESDASDGGATKNRFQLVDSQTQEIKYNAVAW